MNSEHAQNSSDDLEQDLQDYLNEVSDPGDACLPADVQQRIQRIVEKQTPSHDSAAASEAIPKQVGHYEVLRPLGAGGMGMVYQARHRSLDREVALKMLPQHLLSSTAVERFHREMRVLAQLSHPHVVAALDGSVADQQMYLAMELVDGCDLRQLAEQQLLSVEDCCELLRQAALGVAALHERDIIHRDLKPTNIMVSRDGVVKIVDLGLARARQERDSITEPDTIVGTTAFTAPEVLSFARPPDVKSDLFSLGRTLQFLLQTGPFASTKTSEQKSLPADLQTLLQQLTTDDVERRLSSAVQLAERLAPLSTASRFARASQQTTEKTNADEGSSAVTQQIAAAANSDGLRPPSNAFRNSLLSAAAIGCVLFIVWMNRPDPAARLPDDAVTQTDHEATNAKPAPNDSSPESDERTEMWRNERAVAEQLLQASATLVVNSLDDDGKWHGATIEPHETLPDGRLLVQTVQLPASTTSSPELLNQIGRLRSPEGLTILSPKTPADVFDYMNPNWDKLKWVYVPAPNINDDSLRSLARFTPSIIAINVSHSAITDECGAILSSFPELRSLEVADTIVGDEFVATIQNCPGLVHLNLSKTQITDAAIRRLSAFPELRRLHLNGVQLSQEDLQTLAEVGLTELSLRESSVSEAAVKWFRKACPDCKVLHW